MELKKYMGVYHRKGNRTDRNMIKDCYENYQYFNFTPGSIVLDFGANIGGFAHMCKDENVESYIAYEADPDNFDVLNLNFPIDKGIIIKGAVSHLNDEYLTFYRTPTDQGTCSGSVTPNYRSKKRRTLRYEVKNYNIDKVIDSLKPTHLKMDIEGTEAHWLEQNSGILPSCIKEFALELHNKSNVYKFTEMWYNNIIKDFNIINATAEYGFENDNLWEFPELNINGSGSLFGVDIFLRRK